MTSPITVLLFQALENYNKVLATTPEKHTLPKALLYSIGTSILAAMLYKSLLRGGTTHSTFLSVFLKPLHFIFGSKHTATATATATATDISSNEPTPFEDKYFKEYDEWTAEQSDSSRPPLTNAEQEHRKECLDNMYYSTVRETIDDYYGDVMMCYDHATMSFAYYARTANIPYKYLETISRKYMIETNAPREIHVDIREEFNKAKDRNTPAPAATTAAATATAPTAETDVFVKLKSYNTASNLNLHTTTNEKTHKSANATPASASATPATSATPASASASASGNKIFREKSNRYSYRGKIADFDGNHKTFLAERRARATATATATATAATATATEATGYAEFKKQWKNTKSAL